MTTQDTSKYAQDQMDLRAGNGWAGPGELVVSTRSGQLFRITAARTKRYLVVDEDGKEWTISFGLCKAAPAGTVWSGPEKAASTVARENRETAAQRFGVGDLVEFFRPADVRKFPGKYVIVRRTSPTRFSLQEVGGWRKCTAPASILIWAK